MIERDTIRLLRECDAGTHMGIDSIEQVIDNVHSDEMRRLLADCKQAHASLAQEIQTLLAEYQDDGKAPTPIAKGMTWIKTNMKLVMEDSDRTVADLMTDGCDMGVKSLSRYLNQYVAADERSKDIAKRLIALEAKLGEDLRVYL